MVDLDEETNVEDLADDIEPACNFGHVIAKEIRENNGKIDDLHEELYVNGYVDDIKQLRRYVEGKQDEHEDRIDFKRKAEIAVASAITGGIIAPLIVWLLGFM